MIVKKFITSIIFFSVFGVFGQTKLIDDRFAFTPGLDFDENIDSPKTYLGYELGSEYTLYANVVSYLKYLSSSSDKIIMNSYGKTYEGRSLEYLIISSKKNISRLENIRKNNLLLSDPRNIKSNVASKIIKENPGIYWLSYNVHGNEASSTEAVMQVAYRLVASNDSETLNILNNSVVILFPCLNPDGRDRYVYWYKSAKSKILNIDQFDYEHDEPWPGGRPPPAGAARDACGHGRARGRRLAPLRGGASSHHRDGARAAAAQGLHLQAARPVGAAARVAEGARRAGGVEHATDEAHCEQRARHGEEEDRAQVEEEGPLLQREARLEDDGRQQRKIHDVVHLRR